MDGIGSIATIIVNITVASILIAALIVSGIFTTITAAQMPTDTSNLSTSHTFFTISSIVAWVSAGLIIFTIILVLVITGGSVIIYASFLILLLAILIIILCLTVTGLNMYALINSYGSLSFDVGWYAALGTAIAASAAVLGVGYFILLLALKQKKPNIETVIIV